MSVDDNAKDADEIAAFRDRLPQEIACFERIARMAPAKVGHESQALWPKKFDGAERSSERQR